MKLLIADDDYQIREGMAVAVDWQSMGIEEVRTAANGKEAMQFFELSSLATNTYVTQN